MLAGFLMFLTGILSFIFLLVGLKITFLDFIYDRGVITTLLQVLMLFGGMIILYMSYRAQNEADDYE